jgi:hypothetical protein
VQRGKLITKAKRKRNADNLKRNWQELWFIPYSTLEIIHNTATLLAPSCPNLLPSLVLEWSAARQLLQARTETDTQNWIRNLSTCVRFPCIWQINTYVVSTTRIMELQLYSSIHLHGVVLN